MGRVLLGCTIAVVTIATQFSALAQSPGSPSSGRKIVITTCASCHSVFATPTSKTDVPPSLEDIAALPSITALSLKVFLRSNHKQMPNIILSNAEADDVIAFILSLKRK